MGLRLENGRFPSYVGGGVTDCGRSQRHSERRDLRRLDTDEIGVRFRLSKVCD